MKQRISAIIILMLIPLLLILLLPPTMMAAAGSTYGIKWERNPLLIKINLTKLSGTGDVTKDIWEQEISKAISEWNNKANQNGVNLQLLIDNNSSTPDIKIRMEKINFIGYFAKLPPAQTSAWDCLDQNCIMRIPWNVFQSGNLLAQEMDKAEIVIYYGENIYGDIIYYPHETSEESNNFDPQSVILHELGHVLGLNHSSDCTAVMFSDSCIDQVYGIPNYNGNFVRRSLTLDDISTLQDIYSNGNNFPVIPPSSQPLFDNLLELQNLSLPDGSVISPNQNFTKSWRIQNTGTTTWGSGYQLVFVTGNQLSAPSTIGLPTTAPGQTVDLEVSMTAPPEPGSFAGYWRMRNIQGTFFGPEIWVKITVPGGSTIPLLSSVEFNCLDCPTVVPPGETFRPTIQAALTNIDLRESRGDMLRNIDGNLFGAWPHIAVVGTVGSGQTYNFTFYANNPITAPASTGTYQTKWRLWRDGDWFGPEFTIQFQVGTGGSINHAPNSPSLINPGDWAVFDGTTPNLQAQHNGDPDGDTVTEYYFEIFESHDIPNSGWTSSNNWTPPGLGYYGYQWRVKVRDSKGNESDWSEVRHFNIKNPTPQIFDFHWEKCRDAWGGEEKVCFCAQTSGGGLELKLNSANDGSENGTWKTIGHGDTNFNCSLDTDNPPNWGQLEVPAGSYRVRLFQRPNVGGWDDANTADVVVTLPVNQRPGTPDGLMPAFNEYVNSMVIDFQWKLTYRTNSYRFIAASDPGFTNILIDQANIAPNVTSLSHLFAQDYENIFWKVISTGPYGTNQWIGQFHIDITPPVSGITPLPSTVFDTQFSVNWSGSDARSGLRWYDIQVRDGARPEGKWEDWLINTTKTAEIFQGQSGHSYYFRVRAMDQLGNWEEWPTGNGDTTTKIDPAGAPQTLWWDYAYSYKRNLIVLNNDNDTIPFHFPIHIHFDNSTTPTAAEIYNASLTVTKGNDVRIIKNNQTELNRFVQRFSATQIDIWFPAQVAINGGQSDSTSYQIYYGNAAASSPPANINMVFLPVTDANTLGLWHFLEGSGSSIADSSGRSHNGTFFNSGWGDGKFGWAGLFNGSNAYTDVGNSSDFNLAGSPMTLEAWIYLTSLGDYPHIISKWGQDGSYFFRLLGGNSLHLKTRSGGEVSTGPIIQLNQWYHVAATYDGSSTMRIYINGVQQAIKTGVLDGINTAHNVQIGWGGGYDGGPFPGYIQHVRISNIDRTDFAYARIENQPSSAAGIQQTQPAQGESDLIILGLNVYQNPDGGVLIEAVYKNQGTLSTQNGFFTDVYVDHVPTGAGDYTGSLSFWVNDPVAPGDTITVITVLQDSSLTLDPMAENSFDTIVETRGTLYAQVDSSGSVVEPDDMNNIFSTGVSYCLAGSDSFEGDDTFAEAKTITKSDIQNHNFDRLDDEDWLKFQAEAGEEFVINTFDLGQSADTYLYLYATDGTTLLETNDDANGYLTSEIQWTAPAAGTYFVLLKHWNPNVGGCDTSYKIALKKRDQIYLPFIGKNLNSSLVNEMVYIPAGEFQMGCDTTFSGYYCYNDDILHKVFLDGYYIDKYEVTNNKYKNCVTSGSCSLPILNRYYNDLTYLNHPVVGVNWFQAQTYCNWIGGRLPTEAEWEKAARGITDKRMFPWGNQLPDCSFLNFVNGPSWDYMCIGATRSVGSYPKGISPFGIMDMAGNVSEWTYDWYDFNYYLNSPYSNPMGPSEPNIFMDKSLRGGSFVNSAHWVTTSQRRSEVSGMDTAPENASETLGFRCVISP